MTLSRAQARALRAATAAADESDAAIRSSVKADAFVQQFMAMTPAQVATYVDAQVTDLASARLMLKRMALMLLLLARHEYRD
jgi:hypothetical protein